MATPPPANCVRVRFLGTNASYDWGWRVFFQYNAATAPTIADCNAIAAQAASGWNTDMAGYHNTNLTLTSIVVEDLSGPSGAVGNWGGSHAGTLSGNFLPDDVAGNVALKVSQRYRGGHPKVYLPCGVQASLVDVSHWTTTFVTNLTAAFTALMAYINATSGLATTLQGNIALSLYHGFDTTGPDREGRLHYPPKYRDTALLYPVSSYALKPEVSSQRRRRVATAP